MAICAELVLDTQSDLGEGALWDLEQQRLLWVDITGEKVHIYDPGLGSNRTIDVGQPVGTVVPRQSGGLALALKRGFNHLDLDTEQLTVLNEPVDNPDHRFNDGKCDPAGRFWAGSCHMNCSDPVGILYCLYADGHVEEKLTDLHCPNGIVWTADNQTLYYIDSMVFQIWALDYDHATGNISNKRVIADVPKDYGVADGMTIDSEGRIWVAHWGGYCVRCWDPKTGTVVETIDVPAKQITSCAFGGPDLDELYITCARTGLDEDELSKYPLSGGLFSCKPGARGVAACTYAG